MLIFLIRNWIEQLQALHQEKLPFCALGRHFWRKIVYVPHFAKASANVAVWSHDGKNNMKRLILYYYTPACSRQVWVKTKLRSRIWKKQFKIFEMVGHIWILIWHIHVYLTCDVYSFGLEGLCMASLRFGPFINSFTVEFLSSKCVWPDILSIGMG